MPKLRMPVFLLLFLPALAQAAPPDDPWHIKARALLEHAVNVPTVAGRGRVPELAAYLADQYRASGLPDADIRIVPYVGAGANSGGKGADNTAALIVRWRAPGPAVAKPIMVMAHMDVVEARREDWSDTDPFIFTEKDGYFYGRGTADIKQGVAATTAAILKLRATGFAPKRDIIVFYTGDEETGGNGARLGASEWRELLDVEFGLNADGGGGGFAPDGRPRGFALQSAEKTYVNYTLTTRNRGGHSSKPRADNAIYQLANALHRLEIHRFAPVQTDITRAYFAGREKVETGALGDAMRAWLRNPADGAAADRIEADEGETGMTRTRCVATMLAGGHAVNALPQTATANINCRVMPDVSPDAVKADLERIVADAGVVVTRADANAASRASPLRPDIMAAYADAVHARHPDSPVFPVMSTGASDARPFRVIGIPVYGVDGSWYVVPTDQRAHGRDERLPVKALGDDVDHWVFMLKRLAG